MEEFGAKSEVFHSSLGVRRRDDSCGEGSSLGEVARPISDSELLRIMECPVCNEFPAPPIYSCEKGHFTCNSCMELLESCSLCEAGFTKVRNFALESIIDSSNFKCRNALLGCPMVLKGADINRHVADCIFRPLECKERNCLRRNLTPKEYLEHIRDHHDTPGCDKDIGSGGVVIILNQSEETRDFRPYYVNTVANGTEKAPTFIIISKRHRTFMCWWAVCLDPEYVNNFKARFSLESKENSDDFSVSWTLPLQPVWKEFDEVRDIGRCAVLPETSLLPFYIDDQSWNLKVEFIEKHKVTPCKITNDYYLLLFLIFFGIFTILLTIIMDSGFGLFYSQPGDPQTLNETISPTSEDFSEEYIGYRGFYYKAR